MVPIYQGGVTKVEKYAWNTQFGPVLRPATHGIPTALEPMRQDNCWRFALLHRAMTFIYDFAAIGAVKLSQRGLTGRGLLDMSAGCAQ